MTVQKVKKSKKGSLEKLKEEKFNEFSYLDTLIQKIETLETEEQVPEIFEDDQLLTKTFQNLLSLITDSDPSVQDQDLEDFDCELVDKNVLEIMTKFFEDGIVEEEEFEDFFTDELAIGEEESDFEGSDSEEFDSEDDEEEENIINESDEDHFDGKNAKKKVTIKAEKKKGKNMKELEMLMAKVDEESDLDEDEYETEEEDAEDDEGDEDDNNVDYDEETGKKDMFEEEKGDSRLSSFEKSQATLKSEISTLETENLQSEKPWSLRGEINARQRPSDSLLEESVDFENLSRPTPQITEERTEQIEDLIKRRIEEAAWDDVERKDGRDLTLLNGMATKESQKSARPLLEDVATAGPHRSLAQVYEDEATSKLTGLTPQDEESREKQVELTALFAKICRHVDGLSGNRFAPKVYVQSDFQIKTLGASGKK